MAEISRLKIAKKLIESGALETFEEIFLYVHKNEVAEKLGVNYGRFLKLCKKPIGLKYSETAAISKIISVTPREISNLVHNQMEKRKK